MGSGDGETIVTDLQSDGLLKKISAKKVVFRDGKIELNIDNHTVSSKDSVSFSLTLKLSISGNVGARLTWFTLI